MSAAAQPPRAAIRVRELRAQDLEGVMAIDSHHTGHVERAYWERRFEEFLEGGLGPASIGVGAEVDGELAGYLLGEVRAFEFGSEACGWLFAVGVAPGHLREGIASTLLDEAGRRFAAAGVSQMRTMVRRNDVPVLSFFRSNGFRGGTFVQLERSLEQG